MKKVVFYDKGYEKTGKSASVKAVFRELASRVQERDVHPLRGDAGVCSGKDIMGIITYRTIRIGIESEGDPGSVLPDSIACFIKEGCSIIVCACRTKGETKDAAFHLAESDAFTFFAAPHFCIRNLPPDTYPHLNSEYAHQVVRWIDWWIDNM